MLKRIVCTIVKFFQQGGPHHLIQAKHSMTTRGEISVINPQSILNDEMCASSGGGGGKMRANPNEPDVNVENQRP